MYKGGGGQRKLFDIKKILYYLLYTVLFEEKKFISLISKLQQSDILISAPVPDLVVILLYASMNVPMYLQYCTYIVRFRAVQKLLPMYLPICIPMTDLHMHCILYVVYRHMIVRFLLFL
jgi:hypothetical protein